MELYPIAKTLHILSFTAWMAGMFYLPRLFSYHAAAIRGSTEYQTFKVMERRLLKAIMTPAMLATWGFGIWLVMLTGYGSPEHPAQWLMVKLALVLALSALHGYFAGCVRKFAHNENRRSSAFYKIINELVTVIFVAIVVMVVAKPF